MAASPHDLGLLLALPGLKLGESLLDGVGCKSADRLALLVGIAICSECRLRGGLTLRLRLGGVLMTAEIEVAGAPLVIEFSAGRGP